MNNSVTHTATGTDAPKMLEVAQEIEQLSGNIDYAERLLNELESRLSPVLTSPSPTTNGQVTGEEAMLVPLAGVLHNSNKRIFAGQQQLQSILDRLQF